MNPSAPHSHARSTIDSRICPAQSAEGDHHAFLGDDHGANGQRMSAVVVLTLLMMVVEIVAGYWSGSMALLADGWHMASHAAALGAAAFAYRYAHRHVHDARYSFGTGKVGDLAAFTSSLLLGAIGAAMIWESVQRLLAPTAIAYNEALIVAVLGLVVNLASALLLRHDHDHDHDHDDHDDHDDHEHHHDDGHHDHNLRAAYLHVLADALTSILAIVALLAGRHMGWVWIDPVVGIVGALVIGQWALGLARRTAAVLLDASVDPRLTDRVRRLLEGSGDAHVADLHLWRLAPGKHAVIASLRASAPLSAAAYKARLADVPGLVHVTIEAEAVATV
ncbi:cation diffusion facilitator family transporter [Hydrocarboniphaga daqingensis]|uniref:Cation diffusion facilitator family transporter n=1 Tax=Hydrocarboniphaga daqingensis TaxID=490188 RepID=A0A1M5LIF5_9GAMM|nr:CDF family Co(II)/Ni(II) efflux transporter DmeF [Hydrocarboniphaga daqingensis]SHG64798.1 cation diffusion facilitator family transporter [Hydrocarboniphaga daqingensis]